MQIRAIFRSRAGWCLLFFGAAFARAAAAPLSLGTTIADTISEPGERDIYTFPGGAGQRLYFDSLDRDFESIVVRLVRPSGVVLWDFQSHSSDRDPFTLIGGRGAECAWGL